MKSFDISVFKPKCLAILKSVARTREGIIVTHRGKPLVRVEPFEEAPRQRILGGLRGCMQIRGDIVRSDFEEDW